MSDPSYPRLNSVQAHLERDAGFPRDIATVQEGLEKLSQAECLVALDEVMARRPHNKTDLRWQVRLWRQDRTAWKDVRDRRDDAKEDAADE